MALAVVQTLENSTTASDNTVSVGISATGAGNVIVVLVGAVAAAGSVTSVADSSNTYTHAAASDSLITGVAFLQSYYLLSVAAGKTSITATFSAAAGTYSKSIRMWEISGFTTPLFDTANAVSDGTSGSTTLSGPSLSMTGAPGFGASAAFQTGTVSQNPKSGSAWTAGGQIDGFGQPGCSIITAASGAQQATWLMTASGLTYCTTGIAIKETGGGGGGRTLFLSPGLDGLSGAGPKQFNPIL